MTTRRELGNEPPRQIIGVVGDVRDGGLNNDPGPRMYAPQGQVADATNALNLRITPAAWVRPAAGRESGRSDQKRTA